MFFVRAIVALVLTSVLAVLLLGAAFLISLSPKEISGTVDVSVERGATLREVAITLKEAGVVRSAFAFQSLVLLQDGERDIVAGDYSFSEPESSRAVARRLREGQFQNESRKVTLPEGSSVQEISEILADRLPAFNKEAFVEKAKAFEGYLFPDTYFFYSDVSPEEVIETLRSNFEEKTKDLIRADSLAEHSLDDIIKMASILEEEAMDMDSRRIVSGILWSRIEEGMPLQVDASFLYIDELDGKNTYTLTMEDLEIDSPYNTYTNIGLPPTPITNPGLESIRAAASPISSSYKFYLSDTQGNMYYAETFDEHRENRRFLGY